MFVVVKHILLYGSICRENSFPECNQLYLKFEFAESDNCLVPVVYSTILEPNIYIMSCTVLSNDPLELRCFLASIP